MNGLVCNFSEVRFLNGVLLFLKRTCSADFQLHIHIFGLYTSSFAWYSQFKIIPVYLTAGLCATPQFIHCMKQDVLVFLPLNQVVSARAVRLRWLYKEYPFSMTSQRGQRKKKTVWNQVFNWFQTSEAWAFSIHQCNSAHLKVNKEKHNRSTFNKRPVSGAE